MKLCLIYLLVVACISTPVTLSKYVSQTNGSSTARVAKFDVPYVTYDQFSPDGDIIATDDPKYYVFESYFSVHVDQEVSSTYTLDIYLDLTYDADNGITMLTCPDKTQANSSGNQYKFTALDGTDESASGITLAYFTKTENQDFETGKIYYSRVENGVKTWYSADPTGTKKSVTITPDGGVSVGAETVVHEYSVLFFVKADASDKADGEQLVESVFIKYDLNCWQVD